MLVVAATRAEIAPVVAGLGAASETNALVTPFIRGAHHIDVLVTGVGMVATAAWCSRALATGAYEMALNLGVCGSFDPALPVGRVVHVVSECLPELGAESPDGFLGVRDLGLVGDDEFPFQAGRLRSAPPANRVLEALPAAHGITVNTVHGDQHSIAAVVQRVRPQVESMEGGAFMYACAIHRIPFAEVRAVSNVVETRNRGAWRIEDAIRALGETALAIIDHA